VSTFDNIQKVLDTACREGFEIKSIGVSWEEFKWFKLYLRHVYPAYNGEHFDDIDVTEVKLAGPGGYVMIRGEK
jgi:hypothetical protein